MRKVNSLEKLLDCDPLAMRLTRVEIAGPGESLARAVVAWQPWAPRPSQRRPGRVTVMVVAAGLALTGLAMTTPAGASASRVVQHKLHEVSQSVVQRLSLVVGAPQHLSPPSRSAMNARLSPVPCSQVNQRPATSGGGGGDLCYPDLSLAAAQRQVNFTIPVPTWLPPGVHYRGALVEAPDAESTQGAVYLSFRRASGGGVGLRLQRGMPVGGSAVPNGSVQRVQVDGAIAYYVHGTYVDSGPGTVATWDPSADGQELTWQHAGLTYDLTAGGLSLSAADMIKIAESIR